MKDPAADRPFWGAEVNTSVKGRSGYRVPLMSAAAGAERESAVIRGSGIISASLAAAT